MTDNGDRPIFPSIKWFEIIANQTPVPVCDGGLTKRELFAITATDADVSMAAQAYLARSGGTACSNAQARVFHADALLSELNKKEAEKK